MLPDLLFLAAIPVAELDLANSVFGKFGYGPGNLSAKVSTKPNMSHTHYGLCLPLTNDQFAEIKDLLDKGTKTKGITDAEVTAFKKLIWNNQKDPNTGLLTGRPEVYGQRAPGVAYDEFLAANTLQRLAETAL